jgi:DNA (cytosine-5)-methyltransferase 1
MQPLTFGSLFAGVGGLDLGLERAGLRCLWQVEHDAWRRRILASRFDGARQHDDARTFVKGAWEYDLCDCCEEPWCEIHNDHFSDCGCVRISEYADDWPQVDLIVGGDPCQENSNARRTADALQSSLGGEFIRILDAVRPRLFLRENPAAVRSDAPWPWWRFRSAAESVGYAVLPFRLRACCVGADHRRDRLFLLGELQDTDQAGLEGDVREEMARTGSGRQHADAARPDRRTAVARICGGADGLPRGLDYRKRIEAVGDAVDVGVAEWIGRRIVEALTPPEQTGRM